MHTLLLENELHWLDRASDSSVLMVNPYWWGKLIFLLFYLVLILTQKWHTVLAFMVFLWIGFDERDPLWGFGKTWCLVVSWVTEHVVPALIIWTNFTQKVSRLQHHSFVRWTGRGFYFLECRFLLLKLKCYFCMFESNSKAFLYKKSHLQ